MPDAFIYDHVRTPRGRGKVDGSLHEVTALNLASQALGAIKTATTSIPRWLMTWCWAWSIRRRSRRRYPRAGCVVAAMATALPVQINCFCASGLDAVNFAAAQSCRANRTWRSAAVSSR